MKIRSILVTLMIAAMIITAVPVFAGMGQPSVTAGNLAWETDSGRDANPSKIRTHVSFYPLAAWGISVNVGDESVSETISMTTFAFDIAKPVGKGVIGIGGYTSNGDGRDEQEIHLGYYTNKGWGLQIGQLRDESSYTEVEFLYMPRVTEANKPRYSLGVGMIDVLEWRPTLSANASFPFKNSKMSFDVSLWYLSLYSEGDISVNCFRASAGIGYTF